MKVRQFARLTNYNPPIPEGVCQEREPLVYHQRYSLKILLSAFVHNGKIMFFFVLNIKHT